MNVQEYLNQSIPKFTFGIQSPRTSVTMNDGFSISIQASSMHYCSPRKDGLQEYDTVELGYPSEDEPILENYAEDPKSLTITAYSYVPIKLVDKLVIKHGGFHERS